MSIDHWLTDPDPEPDSFIYHYTDEKGALGIIASGKFRLGSYDRMNDPREAKEWVAEQLVFPPRKESLRQEVDRILRRCARIGCFTADSRPTEGSTPGTLFHRGWGRASAWDRYADRHRGACLVFDMPLLSQTLQESLPLRSGNVMGEAT